MNLSRRYTQDNLHIEYNADRLHFILEFSESKESSVTFFLVIL